MDKDVTMRHFAATIGCCLLFAQQPTHAASIGNIHVRSSLSQRFSANITLALNAGESVNDLHVQLAPYDKFTERGIPWSRDVLKLHFSVASGGNGAVVRVHSTATINEPVLVFLLQVSSGRSTVYRQFTVLLDPPAAYEPIRSYRQVAPPPPVSRPNRRIKEEGYYRNIPPAMVKKKATPLALGRNKEYVQPSKPYATPKKPPAWVNVRRNDSLSKIARRLQMGVTAEQMAIALFNANPAAFFSPNINALKAGQVLHIPERKALQRLDVVAAKAEFYRQNREWRQGIVVVETPKPPPQEAKIPEPTTPPAPIRKLTLSAPSDAAFDMKALILSDEIAAAIKPATNKVDALDTKLNDLQGRLHKMEQQVAEMKAALMVRDEQLAALQNQAQEQPSWLDKVAGFLSRFVMLDSRSLLYLSFGLLEFVVFVAIALYFWRDAKKQKQRAERYRQPPK
jgi:pilus assembly protein FimV